MKPRQLAHVVRRTSRFDELVQWYCTVLGAEVVHSDGMLAFLTYDDEHHRIAIAGIPGLEPQPAMAAGTDHIAFTYAESSTVRTRSTCCASEPVARPALDTDLYSDAAIADPYPLYRAIRDLHDDPRDRPSATRRPTATSAAGPTRTAST